MLCSNFEKADYMNTLTLIRMCTLIFLVDNLINRSRTVVNDEISVYKLRKIYIFTNQFIISNINEDFLALCNFFSNSMQFIHLEDSHWKLAIAKMGSLQCPKRLWQALQIRLQWNKRQILKTNLSPFLWICW